MENWHTEYMKKCRKKPIAALRYIIQDCRNAILAMPDNPKCGQYQDEIHYCHMELKRRGL